MDSTIHACTKVWMLVLETAGCKYLKYLKAFADIAKKTSTNVSTLFWGAYSVHHMRAMKELTSMAQSAKCLINEAYVASVDLLLKGSSRD